jgi:hypothetical protein
MSITRIAPKRCSIACSPGAEQERRSRSRGRSTTASTPDWTSGRRFGLLNEARAPNGGRPTLRAGIVLTLPRWTRCRLRLAPAVCALLDSTTMPARCPGRRGHAWPPTNLPARWRASERWGVQRFAAPPSSLSTRLGPGAMGWAAGWTPLSHATRGVARRPCVAGVGPATARLRLANPVPRAEVAKWPAPPCG